MNGKKLMGICVTAFLVVSVLAMLSAGADDLIPPEEELPDWFPVPGEQLEGGEEKVSFDNPSDVAVDSSGNVFVADAYNDRIQKFDSDGSFITTWGSHGTGDGEFYGSNGIGIAVDSSGNVFVADTANNRIPKFDSDGNFNTTWGCEGTGEGEFDLPKGIAVDNSSGNVFVVESGNNRIQKFDSDGNFNTTWGEAGTGNGIIHGPIGVIPVP